MSRVNLNGNIDQSVSAPLQNMDYNAMQLEPMLGNTTQMDYGQYQQDMYYSHASAYPLNYHLYAPSSGTDKSLASYQRRPEDFFISNNLREELQRKNEATLQTLPGSNLPEYVHVYHSLVPIETNMERSTQVFGYPTWAYKATSSKDGRVYCLRRIVGYRLTNEKSISIVQVWNSIKSPSIVGVVEAFTTRAFGDSSLVFVYDYFPLAKTLEEVHFGSEMYQQMNRLQMPEGLIWRYIIQITSALRAIHGSGLAARLIEPKRILVTGHSRIRLNCCGIFDVLNYDLRPDLSELQKEDIQSLGKIVLMLASNSVGAALNINSAIETIERVYSKDLTHLIKGIFIDGGVVNIDSVVAKSAPRLLDGFNDTLDYSTYLENELSKDLENGRVARLLIKFGMINERPEYDHDPAWSETGERFPIKMFRDFLFYQEDENGKAVVDMAHVLRHLNKLDAGIEESIMLVSRDEQTCMLITYKELKACVESAFRELCK